MSGCQKPSDLSKAAALDFKSGSDDRRLSDGFKRCGFGSLRVLPLGNLKGGRQYPCLQ